MPSTVRAGALWLGIAACGGAPPPAPAVAAIVAAPVPFPAPSTLEYLEHTQPGPMPQVVARAREVYEPRPDLAPPAGHAGVVIEATSTHPEQDPEGDRAHRSRYLVGPEGIDHFAAERPDGWDAYGLKVELPTTPAIGDRWTGSHGAGERLNERTCEVEVSPFCADGWAVACTIHWADRATWMRHHWCPADGWVGFEAVLSAGPFPVRIWSTDVTRDGRALPGVPIEGRPMAEPPELRPPAAP